MITPLIIAALLGTGCSDINPTYTPPSDQDTQTGTATGFALGADISWTTKLESEGEVFYNSEGTATECTALMKELGMDAIRLRVWVDPEDGWSSRSDVLAKALRAQKLGMRIMIDFHYSDTWADPARQLIPQAWLEYNTVQLAQAVTDHTTDVLTLLKDNGVEVTWVQVGNEVTHGMLRHTEVDEDNNGSTLSQYGGDLGSQSANFAAFIDAGYSAVKSVYPDAQVVVHVDRGHNIYYANAVFSVLDTYDADYDIIGLSLYPGSDWQEPVENCIANISTLYSTYGHDVMIVETGMDYSAPDTAYEMLSYLIENSEATGHCLGVFYWEPEAPAGYNNGYNMGAFDGGRPTHALDAFTEAAEKKQ